MAFVKTSIAYSAPKKVDLPESQDSTSYEVGYKKDGKIWDGEKWVYQAEWDTIQREGMTNG